MGEEYKAGKNIPEGVSMGGSDLFSNFMGLFFDPVMSFCEGAGIGNIKIKRTKWSDIEDAYGKSNGWYGYNMKVNWQPGYPKKPEIPERPPKKPEYPGIGEDSLINSYWIGDKVEDRAKKIGKYNSYKDRLESYRADLDETLESLPTEEKEKLGEYISRKPFNYT